MKKRLKFAAFLSVGGGLFLLECAVGLPGKSGDPASSGRHQWYDYWYYLSCLSPDSLYKALDVDNTGGVKNGSKVQVWAFHGRENQTWKFIPVGNDYYRIVSSADTRLSLDADVAAASVGNGTKVQVWEHHGADNQQWQVLFENDGQCIIRSKANPALALDADILPGGGQVRDGSKVQLWTYLGKGNQKWGLDRAVEK